MGSKGRRGYREWAAMPERLDPDATWWARDPHWFPAGTPPRGDTRVDVLIDGEETFRAAWDAIQNAKHSVWLVDWAMSSNMALVRGAQTAEVPPAHGAEDEGYTVYDLLTDVARRVDVRVLIWSGSLIFRPYAFVARHELERLRAGNPRIQGRVDKHIHFSHCHHQKTIVVDGRIAFVGGLDMTDFDIDRWDTTGHPLRKGLNWHDLCVRLEGEAAADVGHNFTQRWQAVTGEALQVSSPAPQAPPTGSTPVQIVRTIPAQLYEFAPKGEFGIAWAYQQGIRNARQFIYLENQYLWSPAVVDELIAALEREQDPDFRIVMVLPARPNIGKPDTDVYVRKLRETGAGRGRVHFFSLYTGGPDEKRGWIYKPIYVHAKVAVIDDAWCTLGSANLNQRGLEGDSEINVQIPDSKVARELRLRLWSEHLGLPHDTIATLSASMAIDQIWVPLADHARHVIDGRDGALRTAVVHYQLGTMPGDLSIGELQARLLDA
jgi:phosphatidylserine/phosphatidylglycerophosphate/cardiolipin synthase-like enzyme